MTDSPFEPQYSCSLVSYVDILGFGDQVKSKTAAAVLAVLRRGDDFGRHHLPLSNGATGRTFTFSDLIVNVSDLTTHNPIEIIYLDLLDLGITQFILSLEDIFVRGAVTVGDIYVEDNLIFGPALIKVHKLEQSKGWPRIMLDQPIVDEIEFGLLSYGACRLSDAPVLTHLRRLLARDAEGLPFLCYLSCIAQIDFYASRIDHYLAEHKRAVIDAYPAHPDKYRKVAQYHDSYCCNHFGAESELIIGHLG